MTADTLRIAGAQMAPVWLDRSGTLAKVIEAIHAASDRGVQLLAFPEAFVPGYPWWIEWTDGARFDSAVQKALHAHYLDQAVQLEAGHLDDVCNAVRDRGITVVLGIIERPLDRGGHSVYASVVTIDAAGVGCEPASAASVAGVRQLVGDGIIGAGDSVVAVLTGHVLKDPGMLVELHQRQDYPRANRPIEIDATVRAVEAVLRDTHGGVS